MKPQKAFLAIQCNAITGETGTFLFIGPNTARIPVSPIFGSLAALCPWLQANGWKELPYDPAHPVGVYQGGAVQISKETKLASYDAFLATDSAWSAELQKAFGKEACNKRYLPEGKGSPGSDLRRTFEARDAARIAWQAAQDLNR